VTETPAPGADVNVTMPVVVSTENPLNCSVPFSATRVVALTGFLMMRCQLAEPDV